jgi:hypothetical protein
VDPTCWTEVSFRIFAREEVRSRMFVFAYRLTFFDTTIVVLIEILFINSQNESFFG